MSYRGSIIIPKGTDSNVLFSKLREMTVHGGDPASSAEQSKIVDNALYAIEELIDDGNVGFNHDTAIQVTISGHANKNYKPEPGVGGDFMQITISAVTEEHADTATRLETQVASKDEKPASDGPLRAY